MQKQDKNFWKRLGRTFNEHAAKDEYRKNRKSIKISHTGLFPNHSVGRGPNTGEPTLLDFSTRITEASGIHFHRSEYGSIDIMVQSKTESVDKTFFDVRKNGKNKTFIFEHRSSDENQNWYVKDLMKVACARDGVESVYWCDGRDVAEELEKQGYSIVTQFDFSNEIGFRLPHHGSGYFIKPSYVKQTAKAIEIGWVSSGTYNSLPNVIKIEMISEVKSQSLREMGLEGSGYYDGHYRCNILPTQAKAVKAFFGKRFGNELKNRKGQRG
jgi:hypothetical protein